MDPTGGWGLKILIAVIAIIIAIWIFAPFAWALGISIALAAAFIGFVLYVCSNTRFT
jgi:hypothetical protein